MTIFVKVNIKNNFKIMLRQTKLIWLRYVNNSMALQAEDLISNTVHTPEKIIWFLLGSLHYK